MTNILFFKIIYIFQTYLLFIKLFYIIIRFNLKYKIKFIKIQKYNKIHIIYCFNKKK